MSLYRGRFAPSPTGPLHQGSIVAAMASYLDARVHQGQWLVRIEDNDFDRNQTGADLAIIQTLQACGMQWDEEIVWQSQRVSHYQTALEQLADRVFPCACSRKEIADSRLRAGLQEQQIYPGNCRAGLAPDKVARSFRLRVPDGHAAIIHFNDRRLGRQSQNLAEEVGDFVLKRADGFWAYQLAVVVDDELQGISHIVRGVDLLDSTARQIYLQNCLNYRPIQYLHLPVVLNEQGEKLSKQTNAPAVHPHQSDLLRTALIPAAHFLGLQWGTTPTTLDQFWQQACYAWERYLGDLNRDL